MLKMSSFENALKGLLAAFKTELHLRVHLAATVMIAVAGFVFCISVYEWLAIVICIGLVITTELINTAIETIVNLVSPQYHPHAGLIKDIAAGAVLVSALVSVVVALLIFIPKMF